MSKDAKHEMIEKQKDTLPGTPGVYLFYNKEDKVIYVGKAKNIKKRVSSYFNKNIRGKTAIMVGKIARIEHFVVETESDALLLENNLIKKYQPRYNVLLKDDKSFPWICIKKEPFPRVFLTRNIVHDGSEYYGPYTSAYVVRSLLDLIRKLIPLRTCKYKLTHSNINAGKFKTCLEYHIGNCLGPCVGEQDENDYAEKLNDVRNILKGNISNVAEQLKSEMKKYSKDYQYEKAQIIKEKLEVLERYQAKTVIVNKNMKNTDVFSYVEKNRLVVVNYLKIDHGAIVQSHTVEVDNILDEEKQKILLQVVGQLRERLQSTATQSIVPFDPGTSFPGVRWVVPSRGDKKKLLNLSERNATLYLLEKEKRKQNAQVKYNSKKKLETLQKDLRMSVLPSHIECFDNSNLQGTHPVAACVVFKNGVPAKKDYRQFNIKSVTGPDDFASMKEVVFRRYKRMQQENIPMPQLVVIDGGKGQLHAAYEALKELGLEKMLAVIGIAKRLEEIYFAKDKLPLYLDKKGTSLTLIRQIRDEAHRFGISFHRKKREKEFMNTMLTKIPGIGKQTVQKVLTQFKSIQGIREAGKKELVALIGEKKAGIILENIATSDKP